jgi:hypothetical protein
VDGDPSRARAPLAESRLGAFDLIGPNGRSGLLAGDGMLLAERQYLRKAAGAFRGGWGWTRARA